MGVVTELAGPAALVVLDWPEKRNALGPDEANAVAGRPPGSQTSGASC
jgi:hypothetical protein